MVVNYTINMLGPIIDMVWVGRLGPADVAAVGISGLAVNLVNSLQMGLFTGTRAIAARLVGAGDYEKANHVANQAVIVSAGFSIIMALLGIFLAAPMLALTGASRDVVALGASYNRIEFIGSITMTFRVMNDAIMQASGDSVTPMKIGIIFRIIHITLSPFLIFGWWSFPRLGVIGAAATGVFSQGVGASLGLWMLSSGHTRLRLSMRKFRMDARVIWLMVKIGIPASIMGTQRGISQFVLMWNMSPFGTLAVAAQSLQQRVDMLVMNPLMGLGQASGVLVGQNLGAREPGRARRSAWLAASWATIITVFCAIAVQFWGAFIISHLFSSDPDLLPVSTTFLRIAAVGWLAMGFTAVLQQSVNGAGDTVIPMIISFLTIWLVQLPLAYIIPRFTGLAEYGVRWGMAVATVTGAISYIVYFARGRWMRKKL
jgi:putative MATE family efflux protein